MNRRSEVIYMIPDDPNTLTWKSSATYDTCRDQIYGLITWNPAHTHPDSKLCLCLCYWQFCRHNNHHNKHNCAKILLRDASFILRKRHYCHQKNLPCSLTPLQIWPPVPYLTQILWFNSTHISQFYLTPIENK